MITTPTHNFTLWMQKLMEERRSKRKRELGARGEERGMERKVGGREGGPETQTSSLS